MRGKGFLFRLLRGRCCTERTDFLALVLRFLCAAAALKRGATTPSSSNTLKNNCDVAAAFDHVSHHVIEDAMNVLPVLVAAWIREDKGSETFVKLDEFMTPTHALCPARRPLRC